MNLLSRISFALLYIAGFAASPRKRSRTISYTYALVGLAVASSQCTAGTFLLLNNSYNNEQQASVSVTVAPPGVQATDYATFSSSSLGLLPLLEGATVYGYGTLQATADASAFANNESIDVLLQGTVSGQKGPESSSGFVTFTAGAFYGFTLSSGTLIEADAAGNLSGYAAPGDTLSWEIRPAFVGSDFIPSQGGVSVISPGGQSWSGEITTPGPFSIDLFNRLVFSLPQTFFPLGFGLSERLTMRVDHTGTGTTTFNFDPGVYAIVPEPSTFALVLAAVLCGAAACRGPTKRTKSARVFVICGGDTEKKRGQN